MSFVKAHAEEMCEEFEFDKFMDDILIREGKVAARKPAVVEETIGRKITRRYSESTSNLIKFNK